MIDLKDMKIILVSSLIFIIAIVIFVSNVYAPDGRDLLDTESTKDLPQQVVGQEVTDNVDLALEEGVVWYPIPEMGIKFQVSKELADELIYVPITDMTSSTYFLTGTNMTGDSIFFYPVDTDSFETMSDQAKSTAGLQYHVSQNKGVLFSTKKMAASSEYCGASSGILGMLSKGQLFDELGGKYIQEENERLYKTSASFFNDTVMAYPPANCWSQQRIDESRQNEIEAIYNSVFTGRPTKFWKPILTTIVEI